MYRSFSPYQNELVKTFENISDDELDAVIQKTAYRYSLHRLNKYEVHAQRFLKLSDLLIKYQEELGFLMTLEMGKISSEARAEIRKCALLCQYYAERGSTFLTSDNPVVSGAKATVSYNALGVILLVMPWNFPLWQVFRCAVPIIGAGNTVILKHASSVPQCANRIESLFLEAGFEEGVFNNVYATKEQVALIIAHPAVRGVSLTGSTEAGRIIYGLAAKYIKPVVLELGGNDPYLVLEDADVELAAGISAAARMMNCGQSCIGAKRFIVHNSIYDEFLLAFQVEMKKFTFGDPALEDTSLGPLSSFDQRDIVHDQVNRGLTQGATLLMGGYLPENVKGAYYPPTILIDVQRHYDVFREEIFGPVALVIRAESDEEAVDLANDSDFGLGAAIFSKDVHKAEKLAGQFIEAGNVFINAQVMSHPNLPFGGIKESGIGRELWKEGMRAFTNVKTVYTSLP